MAPRSPIADRPNACGATGAAVGPANRPRFVVSALATIALLVMAAALATDARPSRVALCFALSSVPYIALWTAPLPGWLRDPRLAALLALVPGLCLCAAPSVLSEDVYRYAWDARTWLSGHDAYARAPHDPALAPLRDGHIYPRINHGGIATIYPPVSQLLFVAFFAPLRHVFALKLGALVAHVLLVLLLAPASRALTGADTEGAARVAWLYALNPLALCETALSGHVDVWVGLLVVAAAWLMVRARPLAAGVAVALTSGIKLVGLFLWPVLARHGRAAALLSLLVSAAMVWPLLSAGSATGTGRGGLGRFAQTWQGNAGPFLALRLLGAPVVSLAADDARFARADDRVALPWLRPLLPVLDRLAVDPHARRKALRKTPRDPIVFARDRVEGLVARALSLLLVVAVAVRAARAHTHPAVALRWVLLTLLLFSPQVHPWYLLWLLPLEISLGRKVVLIWGIAILGSYASLDGWVGARSWVESAWYCSAEYTVVFAALLLEQKRAILDALTGCYQRLNVVSS